MKSAFGWSVLYVLVHTSVVIDCTYVVVVVVVVGLSGLVVACLLLASFSSFLSSTCHLDRPLFLSTCVSFGKRGEAALCVCVFVLVCLLVW